MQLTKTKEGFTGLTTETEPLRQLENVMINCARDVPDIVPCKKHALTLHVAAGGPSLADTWKDLRNYSVAVNGSLGFLLDKGHIPNACAVLDPGSHMPDIIAVDQRVRYFVASVCDPAVFDKLLDAGCDVHIWHPSGLKKIEDYLSKIYPDTWYMVGGGTTMGMRWLNLGYVFGFRKFVFHGLDSSFRGDSTHAYPDRKDGCPPIEINGYKTRLNFIQQVSDMAMLLPRFVKPKDESRDPCEIELKGDGLMQACWRNWLKKGDEMSGPDAFMSW